MRALEHLFGSRPARIGIILVWLILGGLGGSFAQRFQDVQKHEESSFPPGSSESVRELTFAKRFGSAERFAAITVVRRDGGLKPRDLRSEAELAICWARLPEGVTCTRTGSASPTGLPATCRRPTRRPRSPRRTCSRLVTSATPLLFSERDICNLLREARRLSRPLRAVGHEALFGLLAVSGMRVGEALALQRDTPVRAGGATRVAARYDAPARVQSPWRAGAEPE